MSRLPTPSGARVCPPTVWAFACIRYGEDHSLDIALMALPDSIYTDRIDAIRAAEEHWRVTRILADSGDLTLQWVRQSMTEDTIIAEPGTCTYYRVYSVKVRLQYSEED